MILHHVRKRDGHMHMLFCLLQVLFMLFTTTWMALLHTDKNRTSFLTSHIIADSPDQKRQSDVWTGADYGIHIICWAVAWSSGSFSQKADCEV